jgi:LemA protein
MMKNKKLLIILAIIVGLTFLSVSVYINMYNKIMTMDENINERWAQVENVMQRRYDLIPNLVNTVKGYASHEKEIFQNIAEARGRLAGAGNIDNKIEAARGMEGALSRLLMVVENYPDLKANANFTRLMDELAGSENRLTVERQRFNIAIRDYNLTIRKFPSSIVANRLGFERKEMFQMEERAREVPQVNFN